MVKVLALITTNDWRAGRADVEAGLSPRKDYLELAAALGADILDLSDVGRSRTAQLFDRAFRRGAGLAWLASRVQSEYDVIFSDGEHIGLPLAAILARKKRRPRHVMIGHWLSPWRKRQLARFARGGIDALIVHSPMQRNFATSELKFAERRVHLVPYQVDAGFWGARPAAASEPLVVSCGLEQRDYDTLLSAIDGVPVSLTIAAASHWSRSRNRPREALPANVTAGSFDYVALRDLYSHSRFVVVPLLPTDFQAGITTVLEAMAAGKAVIATRTPGQQDALVGPLWTAAATSWPESGPAIENASGIYVPPQDPGALRSAMRYVFERPDVALALGANGKRSTQGGLERYVAALASLIDPGRESAGATPALQTAGR